MTQEIFKLQQGTTPLLISMPHVGTQLPDDLKPVYSDTGLQVDDTDWHIAELYDFAQALGVSTIRPVYSRYVIDLNRPADGQSLYPGQNSTGLCPLTTFDNVPLYRDGMEPDAAETARRLPLYWHPYHNALAGELARIKAIHGYALLWDAHSIRSLIPHLFEGELPVFNFGSASGASCAPGVAEALLAQVQQLAPQYPAVLNGRFKGGFITRNYGQPADRIHAVQLELAQRSYMQEQAPYALDASLAAQLKPVLEVLIKQFLAFKPA
ncbi:N-formylglutamate deformylase [Herbaspirillum sp. alder98]|uniref:N-formylglutamate deformylase n=1 Tax=Herbaspirillum sp. alder98 TaxID=2913096 RepID=UPI001CD910D2|nr:N-formylglutamate deformylase [Herbaspirillum sp. alder98]MCA1323663.1 N-formylglutamate deformylase [Herbaspirillum sp. alder98]